MLEYLFTLLKMTTPKIILTDEGFDINDTYIKSYGCKIILLFYGDNDKIDKLLVNIGFEKVKNYDYLQYID